MLFSILQPAQAIDTPRQQYLKAHLQKVLPQSAGSLERRLQALISVASNDHEKAWLIYQWVTHQFSHDERLAAKIGNPATRDLEELHRLAGGSCAVYANVTHRLLEWAGLEVKTIYGVAKGGSATSLRDGKRVNHVWNAVKLNGEWYLIDSTWGAGYVGRHGFEKQQSDMFFMVPAELAVLSHFDEHDELGFQRKTGVDQRKFNQLPEDAVYAAAMGFRTDRIIDAVSRRSSKPLVTTFDQKPGVFKVLEAPVEGVLTRTSKTFAIDSGDFEELVMVQGKSWTTFNKRGARHFLSTSVNKGELIIMGRRPKQTEFEALLAYTVM